MRRSLEQIRAAVALSWKGEISSGAQEGDKIRGFPTMIQTNGLLATLAYAVEEKKGSIKNRAENDMARAMVRHLNTLTEENWKIVERRIKDPEDLASYLSTCRPDEFRRINAEIIAFLNYLRRFAS